MPTTTTLAALDADVAARIAAAGWRCECTGQCGRAHPPDGRCRTTGQAGRLLLAAPGVPLTDAACVPVGELGVWCGPCHTHTERHHCQSRTATAASAEPVQAGLFDPPQDGGTEK